MKKQNFIITIAVVSLLLFVLALGCTKKEDEAAVPTLTTDAVTKIKADSAFCGGNVTADGGAEVTARGVCWSLYTNPTIDFSKTSDGVSTGAFTSTLTSLKVSTTYYVRAYATNNAGTGYGNEVTFTTTENIPTCTTSEIIKIGVNSARCLSSISGANVTAKGICWGTSSSPTVLGSHTVETTTSTTYFSDLTGLTGGTTYYVRAYATNVAGTGYGNELTFTTKPTPPATVTDVDGNVYHPVIISTQVWLKENMASTKYPNGATITGAASPNNDPGQVAVYGRLYDWSSMMNGAATSNNNPSGVQGICPSGWHVPSHSEFDELESNLGGNAAAGGKLKESGFAHWNTPDYSYNGGSNESGFTALPAGYVYGSSVQNFRTVAIFWSTSYASDGTYAWSLQLHKNSDFSDIGSGQSKVFAFSVRCLRD